MMKRKVMFFLMILMLMVLLVPHVQAEAGAQQVPNSISGTVYDSAGKPVKGATVIVSYAWSNEPALHVTTDYKGRYNVTGIQGEKIIYLNALPPERSMNHTGSIVTRMLYHSGNQISNLKLLKVDFAGNLTDERHRILPGRRLALFRAVPQTPIIPLGHLVTDREGKFSIGGLVPGWDYEIYTEDPDTGYLEKNFAFRYKSNIPRAYLVWQNHFMAFQPVDDKGHDIAAADYQTSVTDQAGNQLQISGWSRTELGIYDGLTPGETYTVRFIMNDSASELVQDKPYVFVFNPSANHTVRTPLLKNLTQITDTIVDEQGNHVAKAIVRIRDSNNVNVISEFTSNQDGLVRIHGLEEGKSYQFAVNPPNASSKTSKYVYIGEESFTYTAAVDHLPNHTLYGVQLRGKLVVDGLDPMLTDASFILFDQSSHIVSYSYSIDNNYQVGHMKEGETYTLFPLTLFRPFPSTGAIPKVTSEIPGPVTFVYYPGMEAPDFVYKR